MPSPIKPSQFEAVVVQPEDDLCTAFVKAFIRFPILLWLWFKYVYRYDGKFSAEFEQDLCNACPEESSSEETTE